MAKDLFVHPSLYQDHQCQQFRATKKIDDLALCEEQFSFCRWHAANLPLAWVEHLKPNHLFFLNLGININFLTVQNMFRIVQICKKNICMYNSLVVR